MSSKEFEETPALDLYDELDPAERAAWTAHLKQCAACRERLDQARRLAAALSRRPTIEPSPQFVAQCRAALANALEREEHGWRRLLTDWVTLPSFIHPSRLGAALTLVVFGFGLGWMVRPRARLPLRVPHLPATASSMTGADLGHINNICQVTPDPQTGQVRITLNAEHRVTMEGSLDDPRIRRVLLDAVKGYDNPGIRLDTLDALRHQPDEPAVQEALLYALGHDSNAGVRLEALKCVHTMNWSSRVRTAVLDAVEQDPNPGVRVAAIDELVSHALKGQNEGLTPVLGRLAALDTNPYVRLKSLAALRELGQ